MIQGTTKKGTPVWVTTTPDVKPNEGGLYCEVYLDENTDDRFDYFCLYADEVANHNEDELVKEYIENITEY